MHAKLNSCETSCSHDLVLSYTIVWNFALVTSTMEKVMFSSLSVACLSVCLSVCLPACLLATLRKTAERIFMKFSGKVGLDTRNNWQHFQDVPFNPLNTGFPPLFRSNPCLLVALQKNGWTDFHEIFRKGRTWHREQSGTLSGCYG